MATEPRPASTRNVVPGFADRLKTLRAKRGWTQAQLAEKAGVFQSAVAKLESGTRTPSLDMADRLARALGVPVTAFLPARKPKPPADPPPTALDNPPTE